MVNSISFASWNALAVFYERWRKTEKTRTISKRMMFHLCCTTKTGVHCVLHTEISCLVVDCTLFTLCAVATVCAWIPTHTHTRTHTHSHTHTHTHHSRQRVEEVVSITTAMPNSQQAIETWQVYHPFLKADLCGTHTLPGLLDMRAWWRIPFDHIPLVVFLLVLYSINEFPLFSLHVCFSQMPRIVWVRMLLPEESCVYFKQGCVYSSCSAWL
jgi:hypothetical protein